MKYNKVFRILVLAVIPSLLMIAVIATPALAASITLSPPSGTAGTTVTVTGTTFTSYIGQTVYILFDYTFIQSALVSANGILSTSFTVPSTYTTAKTVPVTVQHSTPIYDTSYQITAASFTVAVRLISISPSSGYVGDTVTVSGTGFNASSNVTIYFDATAAGTATTNTSGTFSSFTFTVPKSYNGVHTIKGTDAGGDSAGVSFSILQEITISPTSGVSGISVTVSGSGFGASRTITIKYNSAAVATTPATITTDGTGGFTASFTVPAGLAGTHSVEASDGTYSTSANFASTTDVTISQTTSEASPGYVGMKITITGAGFQSDTTVTVTYTTEPVTLATINTDENGNFTVTVTIPPSAGGSHIITVTDNYTTKQFSFFMESTAPAIPSTLLPLTGDKAKSKAYFDWENVKDSSKPVTYDLQIASDADFSNIFLEKTELTTSTYTLIDAEKLKSTKKEAPYYWRIRAVDAASNASDWSDAGIFYVGSVFPQWAIYALMGLGGLVLFRLGVWVGRRRGSSGY